MFTIEGKVATQSWAWMIMAVHPYFIIDKTPGEEARGFCFNYHIMNGYLSVNGRKIKFWTSTW